MTKDEAIKVLLKYVTTDHADHTLHEAVDILKEEKKVIDINDISKNDEKKEFEVAVSQRQIITYKVLHDSADVILLE